MNPQLLAAATALAVVLLVWLLSLHLRDASIIDVFWGLGFALIAWLEVANGSGGGLLAAMVTLWGGRLAAHIALRNHGRGEDFRYAALRTRHGDRFWIASLTRIYLVQGALMWIVSLPLQVSGRAAFGPIEAIGTALWAFGLLFEAIGDAQLARFTAAADSAGRVMDLGLWRYTRHPNYFGDVCAWWGIGIVAAANGAWWVLLGPATNTLILARLTGKPLLEATIAERRPGYTEYLQRTSGFVPLPPRRAARDRH